MPGAVAEQHLSGTERQFERAVGADVMPAVADLKCVVSFAIDRIRIRRLIAEQLAPGVGHLDVADT